MKGNLIIGQSGGPTAVINSSLAGVIKASWKAGIRRIYGMHYGIEGFLNEDIVDIEDYITSGQDLSLLKRTPSSFLGTCRYKLPPIEGNEKLYEKIFDILDKRNIEFCSNGSYGMSGVVRSTSRYKLLHAIVHLVAETEQMLLAAIIQCCHVSTLKNKSLIGSTLA